MSKSADYNLDQKMKIDDTDYGYEGDRTPNDYADKSIKGECDGPDDNNHEVEQFVDEDYNWRTGGRQDEPERLVERDYQEREIFNF